MNLIAGSRGLTPDGCTRPDQQGNPPTRLVATSSSAAWLVAATIRRSLVIGPMDPRYTSRTFANAVHAALETFIEPTFSRVEPAVRSPLGHRMSIDTYRLGGRADSHYYDRSAARTTIGAKVGWAERTLLRPLDATQATAVRDRATRHGTASEKRR